jgi:hypothetical protein
MLAAMISGCGEAPGDAPAEEVRPTPSGSLTLRITDSPADFAEHVFVQIHGVQLQGSGGNGTTFYYCRDARGARIVQRADCAQRAPMSFDLLALTDGASDVLLGDVVVDAGSYVWVRLLVDAEPGVRDSYIVVLGAEYELTIPGAAQTGLKVNRGFEVGGNGGADFTIDFDLRTSIAAPKSGTTYILRPTLRMVDSFASGAIAGGVDASWMTMACNKAVVYVFSGANVTPDDIDKLDADPVATGRVRMTGGGTFSYKVAFLDPGSYTVAFLCQGAGDDPEKSDALPFSGASNATVNSGATTAVHFGAQAGS